MHIISRKALRQFWELYPDSKNAISHWFNAIHKNNFGNFNELRAAFPQQIK